MTKTEALELAKEWYYKNSYGNQLPYLCYSLPVDILDTFKYYWDVINDRNYGVIDTYFLFDQREYATNEEGDMLRLLVLHQFINDAYKD